MQNGSKDREPKCSHYPVKSATRLMSTGEQHVHVQLVKHRMVVSRNDHILAFGEVFETSLTSWNSLNIYMLCHSFHTLLHMANSPKSMCHTP